MLPSIIKENFLTSEEINFIELKVLEAGGHYDDVINNHLHGYYKTWSYYNSKFQEIRDLLEPKFKQLFDFNFVIDHSHILVSQDPYEVHTDYYQHKNYSLKLLPAYTLIIPLDNYNSNTIVFEQLSEIKDFGQYLETTKPEPVKNPMSGTFVAEYLSHINQKFLPYLSLKEVFPWKQGSIHAADRRYFHSSDNYRQRGLTSKKAFIFWLSTPI